jgi:hypothetical protein
VTGTSLGCAAVAGSGAGGAAGFGAWVVCGGVGFAAPSVFACVADLGSVAGRLAGSGAVGAALFGTWAACGDGGFAAPSVVGGLGAGCDAASVSAGDAGFAAAGGCFAGSGFATAAAFGAWLVSADTGFVALSTTGGLGAGWDSSAAFAGGVGFDSTVGCLTGSGFVGAVIFGSMAVAEGADCAATPFVAGSVTGLGGVDATGSPTFSTGWAAAFSAAAGVVFEADMVLASGVGVGCDFTSAAGGVLAVLDLNFFLLLEGFFAMLHSFLRSRSRDAAVPGPIRLTHQDCLRAYRRPPQKP